LLHGQVVTPDVTFAGDVLIQGDTLACVDVDCSAQGAALDATVVDTHGIILPGLIDTHNHILFDIFDETDWTPTRAYGNHNQWTGEARYSALVDAKQYLNGESSPVNLNCEMEKYGELKGLIAGTTSIVGAANPANKGCYGTLARTIDQSPNGLGSGDHVQVATLFPSASAALGVCNNFAADGGTDAYLIHIAEGVDATALAEFNHLATITNSGNPGCLDAPETTIVHGVALGETEFAVMEQHQMNLVWSPKSNVFLYGSGTDLTKTANIPLARSHGINISLAPDWSIGGSVNLLDELRFAQRVDQSNWGGSLTPQDLAEMVTRHPAHTLGLGGVLGVLAPGAKADVVVIDGDPTQPYQSLLAATPREVRLVLVGGEPLYGDVGLVGIAQVLPVCDTLDVCCRSKFLCTAQPGTAASLFGESFGDIQTALVDGLAAYDAMQLSPYTFSPLAPLFTCPQ
jgi:cytosine/adenosine deaminase-related metal-dependent hydrolase